MTIEQSLEQAMNHHRAGRLGEAEVLYRAILAQQPDHADALHLLGVLAHQIGRNADAVDLIRKAISVRPDAAPYYNNWGVALSAVGRHSDAIAAQSHAVALDPTDVDSHNNLARSFVRAGQPGAALGEFRAALALTPSDAEILSNLSNVLRLTGDLTEAIAVGRKAISLRPDLPAGYNNLGAALHMAGEFAQAIETYGRAIALRPEGGDAADVYHNLGVSLHRVGRFEQAIEAFTRATELQAGRAESFHQLAYTLRERGRLDEGMVAARRAIALDANHADAHNNLGIILCEKGLIDEAADAFRQAIVLRNEFGGAYNNLGNALKDTGEIEGAIACYRQAARFDPHTRVAENLLYSLHFHPGYDAKQLADEHAAWNQAYARPLAGQIIPNDNERSPDRRLRVGYVSMDLREHPVGRFLLPLLKHHDHSAFEIFCYTDLARPDAVTEKLKNASDAWRTTTGLSDEALAKVIREDRIDILVDLAMHMDGTRMLTFARKPAPVQVTYLAYCSTTGLETIDYRLTDPFLDPPGIDESIYSEKSVRLAHTYWCYEPPATAPGVAPLPAATKGHVTFGSLNNFGKVSRAALSVWMEIMGKVPGSELIIHAGEGAHRERVQGDFAQAGISPDRIHFVSRIPISQYMHQYNSVDIALDTFPYPGGTTTCDAFYMGVPVITLAGPTAATRGGVSILSNVGLTELIADSKERYVQIGVELAGDLSRLAELRSTMRDRMSRSALMDGAGFARDVEREYREMWKAWCESDRH
ncbi:MAG TPA: tetratricopeptide repeat protein [Tepidisphaeraceae bacterium]|jgi:predicted O-linked N-acetylglucosamine transferase (SPINDLY family)